MMRVHRLPLPWCPAQRVECGRANRGLHWVVDWQAFLSYAVKEQCRSCWRSCPRDELQTARERMGAAGLRPPTDRRCGGRHGWVAPCTGDTQVRCGNCGHTVQREGASRKTADIIIYQVEARRPNEAHLMRAFFEGLK